LRTNGSSRVGGVASAARLRRDQASGLRQHNDGGIVAAPHSQNALHTLIDVYRSIIVPIERVPAALPEFVLRLGVADVFWRAGLTKLPVGNDTALMLFREEYKVSLLPPELAAYLATFIESTCPVMLVLGVLTRPVAAVLLAQTVTSPNLCLSDELPRPP